MLHCINYIKHQYHAIIYNLFQGAEYCVTCTHLNDANKPDNFCFYIIILQISFKL